jgi:pSer/pThr/pTyr-binding forkhead associated (FHA) protein
MMTAVPEASSLLAALSRSDLFAYALAIFALGGVAGIAYFALQLTRPDDDLPASRGKRQRAPSLSSTRGRGGASENGTSNGHGPATALLREKGGDQRAFTLGLEPAVIGASSVTCTIVLDGEGIAPEHARIWQRGGRYLLHHVGGLSRKTYVSGQEADWVVLEPGDEVSIGRYRLVFEGVESATAVVVDEEPGKRELSSTDDLDRMEAAVRALWAEASPASETAVGERSGTGKFKVHRRKEELAARVGGQWVKRGRTVVLER